MWLAFLHNVIYKYARVALHDEDSQRTERRYFFWPAHTLFYRYSCVSSQLEMILDSSLLVVVLPMGVTEMALRGIAFAGRQLGYRYNSSGFALEVTTHGDDVETQLGVIYARKQL